MKKKIQPKNKPSELPSTKRVLNESVGGHLRSYCWKVGLGDVQLLVQGLQERDWYSLLILDRHSNATAATNSLTASFVQ